jgi:hypothetical protein
MSNQPPVDYKSLCSEDRLLFGKYVHNLLTQNKWISLEEAQRQAYQMVCAKRLDVDISWLTISFLETRFVQDGSKKSHAQENNSLLNTDRFLYVNQQNNIDNILLHQLDELDSLYPVSCPGNKTSTNFPSTLLVCYDDQGNYNNNSQDQRRVHTHKCKDISLFLYLSTYK